MIENRVIFSVLGSPHLCLKLKVAGESTLGCHYKVHKSRVMLESEASMKSVRSACSRRSRAPIEVAERRRDRRCEERRVRL